MNEFIVTINERKYSVKIDTSGVVVSGGRKLYADLTPIANNSYVLRLGDKVFEITSNKINQEKYGIIIDADYFEATVRTQLKETVSELQNKKAKAFHHSEVKAPMPGLLLKLRVKEGDEIKMGESIMILEAMKMENELRSPSSGVVTKINFKEGQSVEKDSVILTIE